MKLVSDLRGFPESHKTPTLPEVEPRIEIRSKIAARVAESVPNPAAGIEPSKLGPEAPVSPQTPVKPLLVKPERPPGRPQDNPAAWQKYASDRDDFMKQQKDLAGRPYKPKVLETTPKAYDVTINRILRSTSEADTAARGEELKDLVEKAKSLQPEDGMRLSKALRDRAVATTAQEAELRRVAAAPEQIAALKEQKGGKLFGQWERVQDNLTEEEAKAGVVARTRNVDISGMEPSERDMYHKLLGHPTTEVLTRDESGQPVQIKAHSDVEQATIKEQLASWTSERAKLYDDIKGSGLAPTPEQIEHARTLTDFIEKYSGLRDRLATEGPRKGQPQVSPMGVVSAPGAIPDVGRTTSNALLDKGIGDLVEQKHKNVNATPEKLLKKADRFARASQLYNSAANAIEKFHGESHENPRVEVPPAKSVAEVSREDSSCAEAGSRGYGASSPDGSHQGTRSPAADGERSRL